MSTATAIEWTDATWNPVTGCTKVSPGCDHCYAERITERFHGKGSFEKIVLHPERLEQPLRWRKPRRVFVNSMSDLFHAEVPQPFIARVFEIMALTPMHTYQILTKRPGRMRALLQGEGLRQVVGDLIVERQGFRLGNEDPEWPLPNVWLGVSVEDQERANKRIPVLLNTSAAVRFLSCEPLIGPITLADWLQIIDQLGDPEGASRWCRHALGWVIVGGESGLKARPIDPDWARSLRDECVAAGVPFFFKQWGGRTPKANGRELDGRTWDEYPASDFRTSE